MKFLTTIFNIQAEHIRWIFSANNLFPFLNHMQYKLLFKTTGLKGMKISEIHKRKISLKSSESAIHWQTALYAYNLCIT